MSEIFFCKRRANFKLRCRKTYAGHHGWDGQSDVMISKYGNQKQ